MSITLRLEFADDVPSALHESPEGFGRQMRLAAAAKWYEIGRLSQGKAAEIAGLSRAEFIAALADFGVSPFQITPDELDREVGQ